ncbi:6-phosphogluconate dehydrogenase NAD-binding [Chthoniobacter flavus Ellin428]|uniref:6-phosphogluconate dehydrogenase NAD-binding n=1 Tax=Chthoniobacter flavus Ellin428 TaxID=497964 RepID=B4D7T4_9BACT|nr:NAD(P)-dependent oxidoreductase [Chthoniobacter flavus]EDY17457.1 6-phosphogluconate dehydrogenase NAD-binding [Chthoniobacter flavus Ellin428]TCO92255.1 3-hydroxyisobutyrate dehydrogenase-like beta-hydroxyacid dehydrogenase [Chthoniobacter flavus]
MSRKARKNVGVIGLGIIGTRVAAGLRAGGFQVYVWNRSAKPAPNFLGSPAEIAESSEVIQIFVADAQALFDVIEAMAEAITPKHVIICSSTVGPEAVLEAAQLVQARGAQFLDAPFTGSKVAAEKKQLVYYVGGDEAAFVRVRPILEATSKSIVRMGEVGHASTIKVVTNMISAVTSQVLAEALAIVQKAGLEPETLTAAIEQNACRSGVIDLKLPKMMSGDYDPHFSLKHMFKDVQLGIHMANALDIEIPATTVTAGVMYGALNQGWGEMDYSVLFKNYTPSEVFDELPALEHVLAQRAGAQPPALPSESATFSEPVPEPISASALVVAEPTFTVLPEPISVTAEPVTTLNGSPAREMVPHEEASRIIEAVLAHVSSQRRELGVVMHENRHPAPKTVEHAAEEKPAAALVNDVEKDAEAKPAETTQPEGDESKSEGKPVNFVRRWFVGRSQS